MNIKRNSSGIALVTALMLTLISLSIILTAIYLINRGTFSSGLQKRYASTYDAGIGGASLLSDLITQTLQNAPVAANYAAINLATSACVQFKLLNDTSLWGACNTAINPVVSPDYSFRLFGVQSNYDVFIQIVDAEVGNSDMSGVYLTAIGVAPTGGSSFSPPHIPNTYKMELQAQRQVINPANPTERANFSILYAY